MTEAFPDKLLRVGGRRLLAALAERGITGRAAFNLPASEPFAGPVSLTIESCRAGSVLIGDVAGRTLERLRQRGIAGIVSQADLQESRAEAGDILLRERDSLIVVPGGLAEEIAEQAAEAAAFEEFTADQVAQGGGVYGLHIPSGDRATQAFVAWRRMKGR